MQTFEVSYGWNISLKNSRNSEASARDNWLGISSTQHEQYCLGQVQFFKHIIVCYPFEE